MDYASSAEGKEIFKKYGFLNDEDMKNFDKVVFQMIKNNAIFKALVALLIAFTLGYFGIVIIHNIFTNIMNNLDMSTSKILL